MDGVSSFIAVTHRVHCVSLHKHWYTATWLQLLYFQDYKSLLYVFFLFMLHCMTNAISSPEQFLIWMFFATQDPKVFVVRMVASSWGIAFHHYAYTASFSVIWGEAHSHPTIKWDSYSGDTVAGENCRLKLLQYIIHVSLFQSGSALTHSKLSLIKSMCKF